MGDPGADIARLRKILDLATASGLSLARVRVGDTELAFHAPRPPPAAIRDDAGAALLSPDEIAERKRRDFYATMYAASEGPDIDLHGEA